ncbi:MAG: XisH protein [Microcoleus sp. SM1_3_4]|nr:XisH protein [Microcoleus sp. SM1_3_4]
MSAKDIYHAAVKSALIKDNWTISSNPYLIQCEDIDLAADIADARPIAAEREGQKIVVEIECFVGRALMLDFHQAVGRYKLYQMLLEKTAPEYELYLAIDDIIYENFSGATALIFWRDRIKLSSLLSTSMKGRSCNG